MLNRRILSVLPMAVALLVSVAAPAAAQVSAAAGASTHVLASEPSAWVGQNYDVTFDTTNDVYLVVYNTYNSALVGQWLDVNGATVGSLFALGPGETPRVLYGATDNAFLLTYTQGKARKAVFLRYQGAGVPAVLTPTPLVLGSLAWTIDSFAGMTYVPSTGSYLVTWWDAPGFPGQSYLRTVKLDGTMGAAVTLTPAGESHEFPDVSCGPGECLVVGKYYNDAAKRRGLWTRWTDLNGTPTSSVFYIDVAANSHDDPLVAYSPTQGTYLVTWTRDFGFAQAFRLAPGATTGSGVFSTSAKLGGQTNLAYNSGTQTFVQSMGGWEYDVFAQQLDALGNPLGGYVTVSNGRTADSRTAIAANPKLGQFFAVYRHEVTNLRGLLLQGTLVSSSTQTLTITKAGTGSGTVTSNPTGISCGATCSQSFATETVVTLTATAATGSTFAGWTGDADCADGSVTMSAARNCKATFNPVVVNGLKLTAAPVALRFSGVANGTTLTTSTPPQVVKLIQTGAGVVSWTATADRTWIRITGGSGTGAGLFTVAIANSGVSVGTLTATITVTAVGAQGTVIPVTFVVTQAPQGNQSVATLPPFGQIDTPARNATGIQGAIAVTGWALDDVGVTDVKLYRNCLPFDQPASCRSVGGVNVVYLGDATLVDDARPDVEAVFPNYPQSHRGGWGYLLLTNLLPDIPNNQTYGGQGSLALYAFATDTEGQLTLLGRTQFDHTPTTITMANAAIAKPFGAIDTPGQGQVVSGILMNFGWVLTPDTNTIKGDLDVVMPTDGSTIVVYIDGIAKAQIGYNLCRGTVAGPASAVAWCDDDVSNIFGNQTPQATFSPRTANETKYRNLDEGKGAIGAYELDTSTLSNGLHTIAWGATDSSGRAEGIGSRYFTVLNTDAGAARGFSPADAAGDTGTGGASGVVVRGFSPAEDQRVMGVAQDVSPAVTARTGFDLAAPWVEVTADHAGVRHVQLAELGRLELQLGPVDSGHLVANGTLRDLPSGSRLDAATGHFTWAPGVGYYGTYRLTFVRAGEPLLVDVTIRPVAAAAPGDAEIRMQVDLPREGETVAGVFRIAGWALDPQAAVGSGIDAVHVWAQRRDLPGARPEFLGAAALGGTRPDVAQAFGPQFGTAAFDLTTTTLASGQYDLTVYVWNRRTARWEDARTVSVTVR